MIDGATEKNNGKSGLSQNCSRAGQSAAFLTFFAIAWDAIVPTLLIPESGILF